MIVKCYFLICLKLFPYINHSTYLWYMYKDFWVSLLIISILSFWYLTKGEKNLSLMYLFFTSHALKVKIFKDLLSCLICFTSWSFYQKGRGMCFLVFKYEYIISVYFLLVIGLLLCFSIYLAREQVTRKHKAEICYIL